LGDFVLGMIIGRSTSASSVIFAMTRLPATQDESESESESKSERKRKIVCLHRFQQLQDLRLKNEERRVKSEG
jgi:hypothetical protein